MDLEKLIAQAQAAIARGADPAAVNARLAQLTNGQVTSVPKSVTSDGAEGSWGAPSRAQSFAAAAGQAGTFGFGDEIAGLIDGALSDKTIPEATAAARARLSGARSANPGASTAGSIAGLLPAVIAPVGAAAQGARSAGLLGAARNAGKVGAAEGGLFGLGNAEGNLAERAVPAAQGAAIGGGAGVVGGGIGGALASLARRSSGRGARVSEALQENAGIRVDPNAARDAADDAVDAARSQFYKPLEDAFPAIDDPTLVGLLRSPSVRSHLQVIAPDVAKGSRAPSFDEAQRVLIRLQRMNKTDRKFTEQIGQISEALENAVPGFREANQAYAKASSLGRALAAGRRQWNSASYDIQRATRGMSPEALTQFRHGQLAEIVRRLEQRDDGASEVLRRFMNEGPEARAVTRTLFPDDASFNAFQQVLRRERSAVKIAQAMKIAIPSAGIGGTAAALMTR